MREEEEKTKLERTIQHANTILRLRGFLRSRWIRGGIVRESAGMAADPVEKGGKGSKTGHSSKNREGSNVGSGISNEDWVVRKALGGGAP